MKIIVLNGSPKGDISVTMQYVRFIQKKFPQHELRRLGLLGIGRDFQADLCLASIRFYSD